MKNIRLPCALFLLAGLMMGCETGGSSNDSGPPDMVFELDAGCQHSYPNGVAITFDGEPIGTVMASGSLKHETTAGDHTWSAKGFGSHTITIPKNGVIQPLICGT